MLAGALELPYATFQSILEMINIACLFVSACGWLLFIIAFGSLIISLDPVVHAVQFTFIPWWFGAFLGPIVYVCAGIYTLMGTRFRVSGIFRALTAFTSLAYIAALAAPLFFMSALFASALGAVEDALDLIQIPDLSDLLPNIADFLLNVLNSVADKINNAIDNIGGTFGFRSVEDRDVISDILNRMLSFLIAILRAITYVFLTFIFNVFLNNVRAQFVGSIISILFLGLAMMTWPFMSANRIEARPAAPSTKPKGGKKCMHNPHTVEPEAS